MNELVQHLADGDHPVTVGGSKPSLEEFQKRIEDMEYVFIKFTVARGGTDLGVRVDGSVRTQNRKVSLYRENAHLSLIDL